MYTSITLCGSNAIYSSRILLFIVIATPFFDPRHGHESE